jgi:hypothetical protein
MRRHALLPFALIALAGCASATRGERELTGSRPGFPAEEPDVKHYRINAVTLQPDTPRVFSVDQDVRIVVADANPFLYDYQILVKNQPITEASIGSFFGGILKITMPTVSEPASTTEILTTMGVDDQKLFNLGDPEGEEGDDECEEGAKLAAMQVLLLSSTIEPLHDSIRNSFDNISTRSAAADAFWSAKKAVYMDPRQRADAVMSAAAVAADTVLALRSFLTSEQQQLSSQVPSYAAQVATFTEKAESAAEDFPSCTALGALALASATYVPDTLVFQNGFKLLSTQVTALDRKPEELRIVARDSSRFYVTALLQRYHRPTDVVVQISRRNANTTDAYRDFTSQRLNFGGRARFSFSAGIVASTFAQNDYGTRTTRISPPPGNADDTLAQVVVATKSSDASVVPMITFNTRLTKDLWVINPQLVLGVGTNKLEEPRIGFLLGLGADAFGERVVLTLGGFIGEETRLSDGLEVGDRVFGSAEVSKVTRYMIRPAVALTYRLF